MESGPPELPTAKVKCAKFQTRDAMKSNIPILEFTGHPFGGMHLMNIWKNSLKRIGAGPMPAMVDSGQI